MKIYEKIIKDVHDKSFIRTKTTFIMLNPTADTLKKVEKVINSHYHVHMFITNPSILNNDQWDEMFDLLTDWAKYFIHIPKQLEDIKPLVEKIIIPLREHKEIKIITEKDGPSFATPNNYTTINVKYNSDKVVISLDIDIFDGGYYFTNGGAITSTPMYMDPDLFKDKIIENFKKRCPEGILKAFRNDDDIWDYVKQNGEWSIKED